MSYYKLLILLIIELFICIYMIYKFSSNSTYIASVNQQSNLQQTPLEEWKININEIDDEYLPTDNKDKKIKHYTLLPIIIEGDQLP
jgi:hypothetical protein